MKSYPLTQCLELACAAQRTNRGYLRDAQHIFAEGGAILFTNQPNKLLILSTLGETVFRSEAEKPFDLVVKDADRELAADIKKYYKRLAFKVIDDSEDSFYTQVNVLLNNDEVPFNRMGFIASLPTTYNRDFAKTQFERRIKNLENGFLGNIGQELLDLDCDILHKSRSKNYDAWNYTAIINNKMASWMSAADVNLGPCVIIKAKVKSHETHYKYGVDTTRMNYVKAFQ